MPGPYPDEFRQRALRMLSEAQAEIKRLKKQIAESEKTNQILRSASLFFATELGRPSSR